MALLDNYIIPCARNKNKYLLLPKKVIPSVVVIESTANKASKFQTECWNDKYIACEEGCPVPKHVDLLYSLLKESERNK